MTSKNSSVPRDQSFASWRDNASTAGWIRLLSCVVGVCWMTSAHAGLGDAATSVEQDRQVLRSASVKRVSMPAYDRHEMQTDDGTTIHEFAARDGTVFAFDFNGPAMPDLKVLLSTHYDDYMAAAREHRGNHHVLSFSRGGVVFTLRRLPRGFEGSAHMPSLLPPGVTADQLR